jgi:Fe-S-cluster containining protein
MSQSFCLSTHAPYRCQYSGACCTAGWHIPAEPAVVEAIELHFGPGFERRYVRQTPSSAGRPAILTTEPDGACTFFDAAGGRLCAIHRDIGEHLLPSACRQFPRVTLTDPRGTWITLSHFCPTAASLLFDPVPLRIVRAPDTISLSGNAEGLDATQALPPLLRPGMLTDFEGYDAWERSAVDILASAGPDAGAALSALHAATHDMREWHPGGERLRDVVTRLMQPAPDAPAAEDPAEDVRRYRLAVASVPRGLPAPSGVAQIDPHHPDVTALWREFDDVVRRYLASKLFASWWPYLGLDLLAVVEAIRVHASVLRANTGLRLARHETGRKAMLEAIRDTDLLMVHLSDCRTLARLIAQES